MRAEELRRHRLLNALQSGLLLVGMAALLAALGFVVGGGTGALWAVLALAVVVAFNPTMSPRWVLRMYQARPLDRHNAPALVNAMAVLAQRAELPRVPRLYHVPSAMMNAFALGSRDDAAVAVTDGMLRQLEPRELAGVLAHEVSHVRNNDTWVMGLADVTSRITGWFSMLGQILFLLNIPLVLMGAVSISWLAIALLIFAPTLSGLIQLALSRTREYDADIGAVELTGDPRGLASALAKLERTQGRWLEQILMPGRRVPDPSLLRTHPPTAERIERLLALTSDHATTSRPRLATTPHHLSTIPVVTSRPRWRGVMGVWY